MRLTRAIILILTIGGRSRAAAQQADPLRQIFRSDSMVPLFAQTSPDGKWVAFSAERGALNASLWLAPTAGGPPIRLTSEGHNDRTPIWFAAGDRISFSSSRPNRNGGRELFLMTLGVDPASGHAVGTPRQVSSEPVQRNGTPSPDGRWIAYVSAGPAPAMRIIPSSGGTARTIAPFHEGLGAPVFSPDGKSLYFTSQVLTGDPGCRQSRCTWALQRFPVAGGAPETVATENHPVVALRGDPRYLLHILDRPVGLAQRVELRSLEGKLIGDYEVPRGTRLANQSGDGLGLLAIRNEGEYSIRVASVSGGPVQVLTRGGYNWAEAWTPDGSTVISDRRDGERLSVELLPLDGGQRKVVPLPSGISVSGWQSSVGPWYSYQTTTPDALHAINLNTNQTRSFTTAFLPLGVTGRGGMEQDGSRLVYGERVGDHVEIRSTDPETGSTMTIRSFGAGAKSLRGFHVNGDQVAWFEERADSFDLLLATGPGGAPRRLATWPFAQIREDPWERLSWSWKGDRLAVCRRESGAGSRAVVTVLDVSAAEVRTRDYDLSGWSQCWNMQWLPDDSGLLTLVVRLGTDKPDILRVPLADGGIPAVITPNEPNEIWEFLTSPDGRHAAYPVNLPVSRSTIYLADFKALLGRTRRPQ